MNARDLARSVAAFQSWLDANRAEVALEAAQMVRELVRARVQEQGVGADGTAWVPSSPAYYTPGHVRRRIKSGYQVSRVDYTMTGALWADIKAHIVEETPRGVVVAIGPQSEANKVKVLAPGSAAPRKDGVMRGLPHQPNEAEVARALALWKDRILNKFLSP